MVILIYLLTIVMANLAVTYLGASFSVISAFLFIGLDLTTRDILHEKWHNHNLRLKMALLILTGSFLTVLLNSSALSIAIASTCAFAGATITDTIMYSAFYKHSKLVKRNGSNLFSAMIDSFLFPVIAFGWPPMLAIVIGQYIDKIFGGFLWTLILKRMVI